MKNMKVAKKLILSFSIVAILCATVGGVGILGMWQINKADTELYELQTKPLPDLAKVLEYLQRMRVQSRELVIASGDIAELSKIETEFNDRATQFEFHLSAYDGTIVDSTARILYNEAKQIYFDTYKPSIIQLIADAKAGVDQATLKIELNKNTEITNKIVEDLTECMNIKVVAAENQNHRNDTLYGSLLTVIIIILLISVAVSMTLAIYISGLISKPLNRMSNLLIKMGTTGNMTLSEQEQKTIENDSQAKDEIGQCVTSCAKLAYHLLGVSNILGKVADGDLTVNAQLLSQEDSIGLAVAKMVDSLNSMFAELKTASDQVSSGSGQVSQGAQELASASSEQAASVQELSAAVSEVREQVDANAKRSEKSLQNCDMASKLMKESMESMEQMLMAMTSIDESSKDITRVIKVIDDIAFQTNILALNAAVEAARAGQHGKGFAVVADEVRNLAAKSAEAAKETAGLIEGSSQRVNEGNKIVEQTNESLKAVGVTTEENAGLIREMTKSLDLQATSVVEINQGMTQISDAVQANAATSQQSAAAAEEMSAQSVLMNEIVARFKLRQDGYRQSESMARRGSARSNSTGFALSGSNFSR